VQRVRGRRRLVELAIAVVIVVAAGFPARVAGQTTGTWLVDGLPVCTAAADQSRPDGCGDGTGGTYFVWQDARSGPGFDVYAIRFQRDGVRTTGWLADGNAVCTAGGDQTEPHVVPDGAGGALVAWLDGRDAAHALYVQHLLGSGEVAPGWPENGIRLQDSVAFTGFPHGFDMVADGSGGALVAWHDARGPARRLFIQRLTGDGSPASGWPAGGLNLTWSGVGDDLMHLSSDGAGGAYVSWSQRSIHCLCTLGCCPIETVHVLAAHVGPAAILWRVSGGGVPPGGGGGPLLSTFTGDRDGGAFWGWNRGVTGPFPIERIDFSGNVQWATSVALHPHWGRALASDGLGGVILVTAGYVAEGDHDILALRLDSRGQVAAGWSPSGSPACVAPGEQVQALAPVSDGTGAAYLAWTDRRGADDDLYGTRMSPMGTNAPGWSAAGNPICAAPGVQDQPRMFADGFGDAVTVWRDARSGNPDIFAQRLAADFPVPTAISVVRAMAEPGVAHLVWFGSAAAGRSVRVQRREPSSEWAPHATIVADGSGRFSFEDREVRPGGRYGYRLVHPHDGGTATVADVWLDIPIDPAFELLGLKPNPASGRAMVSFELSDREPARLEVLDVHGRIVLSREVGALGRGHHVLPVAPDRNLSSGLYFIRLTRAGEGRAVRGIIVH
jgi:hypothetical protein